MFPKTASWLIKSGAGDGIRTRDIRLGKPTLYQLSYARPETGKIMPSQMPGMIGIRRQRWRRFPHSRQSGAISSGSTRRRTGYGRRNYSSVGFSAFGAFGLAVLAALGFPALTTLAGLASGWCSATAVVRRDLYRAAVFL